LSAFFVFSNKNRAAIKAETPGMSVGDVAKKLGEMWKVVDAAEKEV
jgi:high mobility group protein B1